MQIMLPPLCHKIKEPCGCDIATVKENIGDEGSRGIWRNWGLWLYVMELPTKPVTVSELAE